MGEKKQLKKRGREEEHDGDGDGADTGTVGKDKKKDKKDKKKRKEEKKRLREERKAAKKAEKADIMAGLPKKDKDGISYTKIQLRHMARRVRRGMNPVPTEEEENERRRQAKIDKEMEENELAGMLYNGEDGNEVGYDEESEGEDGDGDGDEQGGDSDGDVDVDGDGGGEDGAEIHDDGTAPPPPTKKAKRAKAVPADYTCMACQNKHQPAHWIYDCPDKKTIRGTNKVAKKLRGLNLPDSRKVFVSGLPFEIRQREVEKYFEETCGKIVYCKLLVFEDTKRCKGQAFMTFEKDESALKAIKKLSGTVMDYEPEKKETKKKKKKGGDQEPKEKKELVLKVTKVKSRVETNKKWGKKIAT